MLDKFIKKVIEEAEKKASDIIREAEEELEARYNAEKVTIDKEYELKLQAEKEKIDKEMERGISTFVMEKEKELLALKNKFIDEVLKKIEERFNDYLRENMKEIIISVCRDINEKDYIVKVPADSDVTIEGMKIEKDSSLKDAFVVSSSDWDMVFNWEKIKASMDDVLREKIGKFFSQDNGQAKSP